MDKGMRGEYVENGKNGKLIEPHINLWRGCTKVIICLVYGSYHILWRNTLILSLLVPEPAC